MSVNEDVPRVRGWDVGEEVIGIADHHARFVERKLRVKEDLGDLGHAGYGFDGKVAQGINGPGVLEGGDEAAAVGSGGEQVKGELGVCLYRIDTGFKEEPGTLVIWILIWLVRRTDL